MKNSEGGFAPVAWPLALVLTCSWSCTGLVFGGDTEAAPKEEKINFEEHIKPIFREHCAACHSESDKESDLALDSYGATLSGGSSGEVIVAGDVDSSRLFALMAHTERPYMPPDQDPIPKSQIELVKTWIEQGMPENSGSKIKRFNSGAASMLANSSLGKPEGLPPMPDQLLRQPVTETERSAAISAMAASPWAPLVAVGGQQQVCMYHSQSGELLGIIPFPEGEPQSLTFTRDGRQILIGGGRHSHSGCAVLVDIASGDRLAKVGDELDIVLAADVTPDKRRIAIAGPQKMIRIYDSLSGELVVEMKKHTDWIFALRYSPDGVLLASGDRSNGLVLWEADTGRLYSELVGHKQAVRSLDFRSDSNVLASGSLDGTIKLWDMYESKAIKSWNAHTGGVTSVAFAQTGLIASAGRDARIKLWDGNGKLQNEFQGLGEAALEVALTGDAAQIAGGDWNGRAQVWQADAPEHAKLIAANPLSIESRLERANAELKVALAESAAAENDHQQASKASQDAELELAAVQQRANLLVEQTQEAENQQAQLTKTVSDIDAQILQLESQLSTLKQSRTQNASQLLQSQQRATELKKQSATSAMRLQESQQRQSALKAEADATLAKLEPLKLRVDLATKAKEQAAADLAAFNSRTQELKQQHEQALSRAQQLAGQVESVTESERADAIKADELREQLKAMQQQLAAMQQKLDAALQAESEAQKNLESTRQDKGKLQSEWQSAQQAAADAEQQLKLFDKSYRRPE